MCARCDILEEEVANLRDRLRALTAQSLVPSFQHFLSLTASEAKILAAAYGRGSMGITTRALYDLLYGDDPDGGPEVKIITIFISKIRRKLRDHGASASLETRWGHGIACSPQLKSWLDALLELPATEAA